MTMELIKDICIVVILVTLATSFALIWLAFFLNIAANIIESVSERLQRWARKRKEHACHNIEAPDPMTEQSRNPITASLLTVPKRDKFDYNINNVCSITPPEGYDGALMLCFGTDIIGVRLNKKYGFYSLSLDKPLLEAENDEIKHLYGYYWGVVKDGRCGVFSIEEAALVIPIIYRTIFHKCDNVFSVELNGALSDYHAKGAINDDQEIETNSSTQPDSRNKDDICRDRMEDMWAERESEANDLAQPDDGKKEE